MCNMKMLCGQKREKMILHSIRFFDVVMFIDHSTNKSVNSKVFVVSLKLNLNVIINNLKRLNLGCANTTTNNNENYVTMLCGI